MSKKNFATVTTNATTVEELIRLGNDYNVIFVPYRPEILKALLDIIPDKEMGGRFTQTTFADACNKAAKRLGVDVKITQKTVSNYCRTKAMGGTKPDTDVLEVMSEVLGVFLVPGLDRTVDTDKLLEYIKSLYK